MINKRKPMREDGKSGQCRLHLAIKTSIETQSEGEKPERKCVESSLKCFSFKFFLSALLLVSTLHLTECIALSFLLVLFSFFYRPFSISFFCRLELLIKLREQSSFVLESIGACVRIHRNPLLLLLRR